MYNKKNLNYYTQLYKIPYNLSQLQNLNTNNQIKIIGYKQIHINIHVPIVELNNFTRIWLFHSEIKNNYNNIFYTN